MIALVGFEASVWSRVEYSSGCWRWCGSISDTGYGNLTVDGRTVNAHRFIYESEIGPVPSGLELDHLCRVRECVRPEHLEPVTKRVNILRGFSPPAQNARKDACLRGHPLSGANVYWRPDRMGRACRACARDREVARVRVR